MNSTSVQIMTCVTLMTADAPGAIAVLRLWGNDPVSVADHLFQPKRGQRGLKESRPGELRLGWFGTDEVVATLLETGGSGAVELEIQGHGSRPLVQLILQTLQQQGVQVVGQQQYQQAHGMGWLERLAFEHLGRATAPRAAEVLWQQADGALRTELAGVVGLISSGTTAEAVALLEALLATARWGERLSQGFQVALAGAPNVGKSTLVNALAGFERVLVSPVAGTTRDLVDVALTIHGWPIVLTDMAGLRDQTADPLEEAGIALARSRQRQADLVIQLFEAGESIDSNPLLGIHLTVWTKMDQFTGPAEVPEATLPISAQTGQGLDELMQQMIARLIPVDIAGMDSSRAVLFDNRISHRLGQVRQSLLNSDIGLALERLNELLAE
jgi:tRNA modification GTPase